MWRISFWSGLLAPVVDALSEEKVPSPPRHLMAMWIRDTWELIFEDDIKAATQAGYFPAGLAFANLLDTEYFGEASSDSSDSESPYILPGCCTMLQPLFRPYGPMA